ncbi:hypothetical protein EON83_24990 [bacterium]|nr:MAG: hypothetical protein EON83_24990 [bacterium]
MQENRESAHEVLQLLSLDKLSFSGRATDLTLLLQDKVILVEGLEELHSWIQSDIGYSAMEAILERLQSQAYAIIFADASLAAELKAMEKQIMAFPWSNVVGSDTDDVGDDIEAQLIAFIAVRLAYGKSNDFVEECLQIFNAGLWPFGWDTKRQKYLAFCL